MDQLTPFEWKEIVVSCLMMHGNAYALPIRNRGGSIALFQILHPSAVSVEWDEPTDWRRRYTIRRTDGTLLHLGPEDILHVMNFSFDGLRGMSVLEVARTSLGTALAGDQGAAQVFSTGALAKGALVPVDDDLNQEEAEFASREINNKVMGWENAGSLPVLTRKLKFEQWSLSMADAQFLESRQFSVEEVARWTGVPPHLLMQTEKQSSWGTGVAEQNRGLSRFTLQNWTSRMEQRFGMWLPRPRRVHFDFAGMDRPVPEVETKLVLDMIRDGLITVNEGRQRLGMDPIPGGDDLKKPAPPPPQLDPADDPEPAKEPEPA
jgi:HK97 family phage portal protein